MPKLARELTAMEVARMKPPGGAVGGARGLRLIVDDSGKRWELLLHVPGRQRRRTMGLGSFPEVSVAEARDAAGKARAQLRQGIDPIDARKAARGASAASRAASKSFKQAAMALIAQKTPEWSNPKHAAQWTSTLEAYAFPTIGDLPVQDVDTHHIVALLQPIWLTKTETATRVRSRIENVLDWSTTAKLREGPNPARWRGHLSVLLPDPNKVSKVEHHASLPFAQMPTFMTQLRAAEGQGARALEFVILTAARSGEVRGATWSEIDIPNRLWTVPAERMKAGKEHRVPLSPAAIRLLEAQERVEDVDLVFPGAKGKPLSDMTLTAAMRRMGLDAVPHGFRSSFRTWAGEVTNFPREVIEAALAHQLTDATEAAYARGDLFAKRQKLMTAWAAFCDRPAGANVSSINAKKEARKPAADNARR